MQGLLRLRVWFRGLEVWVWGLGSTQGLGLGFLGYLPFETDPNHKTRYPNKGRGPTV